MRKTIPILAVTALSAQLFAEGAAGADEPTPPPVTRPTPSAPIAAPPPPPEPRMPSGNGKRSCFDDACKS